MTNGDDDRWAVSTEEATVRIGARRILGPISLSVGDDDTWVVLGPNGSGKTTLLDLAGALRHPTTGSVTVLGERLGGTDVRTLRTRIGFVGHHVAESIPTHLSVRDVVLTGKRSRLVPWMQTFDDDDRLLADRLLQRVRCAALADRPLWTCSQGERQRILLGRALFGRHELLLLDEPMAGLDLPGREMLLQALSSTADVAPASILVTHHLEEIPDTATHALLLREGIALASGPIAEVLTDEQVGECFGLSLTISTSGGRWRAEAR